MKKIVSFGLSTLLGFGFFPFAPGTIGSFISLFLVIPIIYYGNFIALVISVTIVFFVGWVATKGTMKYTSHDPKFVVIDETVGQWLTFLFVVPQLYHTPFIGSITINSAWWIYGLGFLLFRFFDILKPHPIKYCDEKITNSFGVMIDDVLAGLYAGVSLFLILFYL